MDKGGALELKKVDGELGMGRFVNQSINVWNGRRKGRGRRWLAGRFFSCAEEALLRFCTSYFLFFLSFFLFFYFILIVFMLI